MSNVPPLPPERYPGDVPLAKTSGMALASMILGIVGIVTGCLGIGILLAIVGLILGIVSLNAINRNPARLGGKGYAIAGIVLGAAGLVTVPVMIAVMLPALRRAKEMANRSVCAANLRGIGQSMAVYASSNANAFPVVPYAPYGPSNGGTMAGLTGGTNSTAAIAKMYAPGSAVAGSPLAGPWVMVMNGQLPPKQFICRSDANAEFDSPARTTDAGGSYFMMFQADNQVSYSFAYPYTPDGRVGGWWRNTADASLPLASDMAPLNGTGKPARDVAAGAGGREGNSGNHLGEGQNVVFGDYHVDFARTSRVGGVSGDNIFTVSSGSGGSPTGTAPKLAPIRVGGGSLGNYDTVMVPERDLDTGKLW